ncbi:MAG TPA: hypothetical protein VFE52_02605 [Devosia sp.]|jgi:hypothetical protein|nr:hypothetical protein [Devosia sp.]
MPRYFFNIHDGKDIIDREGTVLTDLVEARLSAVELAGRCIAELGDEFWGLSHPWRLEVSDTAGTMLFSLRFSSDGVDAGSAEAPETATPTRNNLL